MGKVQRTILRLAFPGGKPRPKPGPYRSADAEPAQALPDREPGPRGPEGSGPEQPDHGVRVSVPER